MICKEREPLQKLTERNTCKTDWHESEWQEEVKDENVYWRGWEFFPTCLFNWETFNLCFYPLNWRQETPLFTLVCEILHICCSRDQIPGWQWLMIRLERQVPCDTRVESGNRKKEEKRKSPNCAKQTRKEKKTDYHFIVSIVDWRKDSIKRVTFNVTWHLTSAGHTKVMSFHPFLIKLFSKKESAHVCKWREGKSCYYCKNLLIAWSDFRYSYYLFLLSYGFPFKFPVMEIYWDHSQIAKLCILLKLTLNLLSNELWVNCEWIPLIFPPVCLPE